MIIRIVGRWFTRVIRDDILDLFYCRRADILYFMTMKILFDRFVGIRIAPAFRRGATKAEARRTEPCGIRRTPAIFRLSEWKAYNVLNIHSENDRDVVRFEKVRSEPLDFPINCPPPSNGIEWTGCEKIRKDNFGGLVSEPILNHKMNQYWYYVKF